MKKSEKRKIGEARQAQNRIDSRNLGLKAQARDRENRERAKQKKAEQELADVIAKQKPNTREAMAALAGKKRQDG